MKLQNFGTIIIFYKEVYKVGLKIQNGLKNKDIEKLYSFIDENSNAPRKVLKVGFENVFEGKMIENVTSLKPSCSPVGWFLLYFR